MSIEMQKFIPKAISERRPRMLSIYDYFLAWHVPGSLNMGPTKNANPWSSAVSMGLKFEYLVVKHLGEVTAFIQ